MSVYIALIFVLLLQTLMFFSYSSKKFNRVILFQFFFYVFFISGFRLSTGGDTEVYSALFRTVSKHPLQEVLKLGYEKGFLLYCYLLTKVSSNPQILILCTSFFVTGSIFLFISKYSKKAWLSIFLYITLLYFFNFMNLMRFSMAVSILLFSIKYIERRKLAKFCITVLIAGTFHTTALVFILSYFVSLVKITRFRMLSAIIFSSFVVFFIRIIFNLILAFAPRYAAYAAVLNEKAGYLATYVICGIYFCIILLASAFDQSLTKRNKTSDYQERNNLILWLLTIGFVFSIAATFVMILTRFTIMFTLVCIVYIPNLLELIKKKSIQYIILCFVLITTFLYMVIVLKFRPEWFQVTPYNNVLFN
jgi:hypothetical protein